LRSISFIGNEGKKIEITIGYGQYKKNNKDTFTEVWDLYSS